MNKRNLVATLAVAQGMSGGGFNMPAFPMGNKYRPHQGPKECARRVRQIETGIIKR